MATHLDQVAGRIHGSVKIQEAMVVWKSKFRLDDPNQNNNNNNYRHHHQSTTRTSLSIRRELDVPSL
jgi:hypothetical protein